MAGSLNQDDDVIAGINVTPLVDVVLVLLVIFLITAPVIYQNAIKVQLPKATTGEKTDQTPIEFSISQDGSLYWGKQKMNLEDAEKKLRALGSSASEQTALISADRATPHGAVIQLMDLLRKVGLSRFALSVEGSTN